MASHWRGPHCLNIVVVPAAVHGLLGLLRVGLLGRAPHSSPFPPHSPSLISLIDSVDVKQHVHLLIYFGAFRIMYSSLFDPNQINGELLLTGRLMYRSFKKADHRSNANLLTSDHNYTDYHTSVHPLWCFSKYSLHR